MALATPLGEGAIGVIRLSGPESRNILKKIFKGSIPVDCFESHKLYLGHIVASKVTSFPPRLSAEAWKAKEEAEIEGGNL